MSKLNNAYDKYMEEQILVFTFTTKMFPIGIPKEDFINKILTDDDFNESYGKECTVNLTEEEIALNPGGPKRKLIEE